MDTLLSPNGLPTVLVFACVAWLPLLLAPGPKADAHLHSLGAGLAGWALGLVVALSSVSLGIGADHVIDLGAERYVLPVLSIPPCLAILLASARLSREPHEQGRVAAARVGLGTAGFLGLGWSLALIPLLTGFGAALPLAKQLSRREAMAAVVAGLQLATVVGAAALGVWGLGRNLATSFG